MWCMQLQDTIDVKKVDVFLTWGDILKYIPCVSVWHEKINFFVNKFILNFVLHTSNYLVWDDKKYIGQAPRPFMTPDSNI